MNFSSILESFPSVSLNDLKNLMEEASTFFSAQNCQDQKTKQPDSLGLILSEIIVNIDGASLGNPGRAGAGGVIKNSRGEILEKFGSYLGETTNNVAEYKSLIMALEKAITYCADKMVILSDSLLLVKQMCGDYKVKDAKLRQLHEQAISLLKGIPAYTFRHIPREENREADRLASDAALGGGKVDRMVASLENRPEESPSSTEQGAG